MAELNPEGARPATILLVDDQEPVRHFVRQALERGGYKVVEANNGFEALAVFSRDPSAIDLILADVVMPGMSGRLLADTLANKYDAVRLIFMSGNTELVRVLNGGCMEGLTLHKPFTSLMLLERVHQALQSHTAFTVPATCP